MLYKDELLWIVENWKVEQVIQYISKLEERVAAERELISELKMVKRKMTRAHRVVDTGDRGGK